MIKKKGTGGGWRLEVVPNTWSWPRRRRRRRRKKRGGLVAIYHSDS